MLKKSIAVIFLCLLPLSVQAKAKLINGIAAEVMAQIMQMDNANFELLVDIDGAPMIDASRDGLDYSVFFYDCINGENCKTLMFYARFYDTAEQISADDIMAFNRDTRWVKAYHDNTGATVLEMDMNFDGKATPGLLGSSYELWLEGYAKFGDLLPY